MSVPDHLENAMAPVYAVILAGGQGTRLWPLSREALPKQFLTLQDGGLTLLQHAVRRAKLIAGTAERVLVTAQASQASLVRQQVPEIPPENLVLEPSGRNTAASIGLAALQLQRRDAVGVIAVLPADHLYEDEAPWLNAIRSGVAYASRAPRLVTIGIPPSAPSSNYGYLHLGQPLVSAGELPGERPIFEVLSFIEKPDMERAHAFIKSGKFLWNTGTFAWQTTVFLEALGRLMPALYQGLVQITGLPGDWEQVVKVWSGFPSISVDHGIMEKSSDVAAVQGSFHRIDVGSLTSLAEILPHDPDENATRGSVLARDSRSNLVYTDEGLVGLVGVEDMLVIRSGDIVLVCPKERATEVKELVAALRTGPEGVKRFL